MYGIDGFHKLINILREFNFEFVDFFSYKKGNLPSIIFRHDIDFSLNDALIIASLEEKLGIMTLSFDEIWSRLDEKDYQETPNNWVPRDPKWRIQGE